LNRQRLGSNDGCFAAQQPLERVLRGIRRRTRVVCAFPNGLSPLNLAAAKQRHIAGTAWSTKRCLNTELLKDQQMRGALSA
jgi:putative transposase